MSIPRTWLLGAHPRIVVIADEAHRSQYEFIWTVRENVRAQLRVLAKRILRSYGYPPDKQEKATRTVLKQAEVLFQYGCTG